MEKLDIVYQLKDISIPSNHQTIKLIKKIQGVAKRMR